MATYSRAVWYQHIDEGRGKVGVESLSIPALPEVAISIPTELMF